MFLSERSSDHRPGKRLLQPAEVYSPALAMLWGSNIAIWPAVGEFVPSLEQPGNSPSLAVAACGITEYTAQRLGHSCEYRSRTDTFRIQGCTDYTANCDGEANGNGRSLPAIPGWL